jgi:hypothetical protein
MQLEKEGGERNGVRSQQGGGREIDCTQEGRSSGRIKPRRGRQTEETFLSENEPFPRFNGAVLSIPQIIKFVMASAAEAELAALFITAREMIPHCQTLIDMGWPQPKSPIQTDNSTASKVVNNTIVPRRSKMMDMRFWWLRCRALQDQFRYYWDAGSKNWADYNTRHHPDTYHEAHPHTHAGIWNWVGT